MYPYCADPLQTHATYHRIIQMQNLNVKYYFPTSISVQHSDKALICYCFVNDLTPCYKHQLDPCSQKAHLWTTVGNDNLSYKKVLPFGETIDHKYGCWQQSTQVPNGTDSLWHKCVMVLTASNTSANFYGQLPAEVPIGTDSFHHKFLMVLTASITSVYWYWQLPSQVPIGTDSSHHKRLSVLTTSIKST
jgi:hypothetical protein